MLAVGSKLLTVSPLHVERTDRLWISRLMKPGGHLLQFHRWSAEPCPSPAQHGESTCLLHWLVCKPARKLLFKWRCMSTSVSHADRVVHIGQEEANIATNYTRTIQNCWARREMTSFLFSTFFILLFELKERWILQGNHYIY